MLASMRDYLEALEDMRGLEGGMVLALRSTLKRPPPLTGLVHTVSKMWCQALR